jgi:hypothetical protein
VFEITHQANILIDRVGNACLADFGLTIPSESTTSNSHAEGGSIRWMGPELFNPETQDHRHTKYSDRYALGMTIYEVLSGRLPFYKHQSFLVIGKVIRGDHPKRPEGAQGIWFTDEIWGMLERCWVRNPQSRPSTEDILLFLEKTSKSWVQPSPRLLAVPSPDGPLTEGFPDQNISVTTSRIEVPLLIQAETSQPTAKPDRGNLPDIPNRVRLAHLFEFCHLPDATLGCSRSPEERPIPN